ncbi:hypothetical protein [Streptomyces sp. AB3(2024)]|uniref:hypothetical protein n=1 Tax=Streptomyces sp. AB3(2024) TaxID=3317321 RepID=UPI0035A374F1
MIATPPGRLPPAQYVETVARSTSYACLYFTDTLGRPVRLRAARQESVFPLTSTDDPAPQAV